MPDKKEAALAGAALHSSNFHSHHNAERWQRVTRRHRCAICNHSSWCRVTADGTVAGCMRIDRGAFKVVSTRLGTMYLHYLRDDRPAFPRVQPSMRVEPVVPLVASLEYCDRVYRELFERLTLSAEHAAYLRDEKGLSDETVTQNLYATAPPRECLDALASDLAQEFELGAVPGFHRVAKGWRFEASPGRLLIPCRDHTERVTAILVRTGSVPKYVYASSAKYGGPSSSAPVHFALPYLVDLHGNAIIIEGVLKADVVAERLHVACIGVPGVASFRDDFGQRLRTFLPALRSVKVAYDADERQNLHVREALLRLIRSLTAAGFATDILRWPEAAGKGLDDVLLGGRT